MGIKAVSIVGFQSCTAEEMKQKVTEFAAARGLQDDLQGWGGQGDDLPFIVVVCAERLAHALDSQRKDGFLKDCAIFIQNHQTGVKPPRL